MLGWALDIPALKSVAPGLVTMKANTALCFVFIGAALWLLQVKRRNAPHGPLMAALLGLGVFGIGLLTLLEYLLRRDLGIDQVLFKELSDAVLTSSPGRMAFNTAINFTLTGLALFLLASPKKDRVPFVQILMVPVGILAALSFVGYLYHAEPLFIGPHFSTAMALHTAVLFLATFLGLLFCRPCCGVMAQVSSDAIGGKVMRRLLPATILIPLFLGWLKLHWEKTGVASNEFGVSFVATANLTLVTLYVAVLSFWLNKSESKATALAATLARSEISYRRLFEAAKDGILLVDFETGLIVDVNQFLIDLGGYPKSEFLGKRLWEIHFLKEMVPSKEAFLKLKAQEYARYEDLPLETKLGYKTPVEFVSNVYRVDGRKVIQCNIRDITERKRAEEALRKHQEHLEELVRARTAELELSNQKLKTTAEDLRRASKAKTEFLANMSHEFRTPLSSVIGFSEVLYDQKFGPLNERQKQYTQNILTSGRHLLSLINDVLDVSKVESGKMVLEVSLFSVQACLEEVLRLTDGLAYSKKINPLVEIPQDLGEMLADQRKIKQIIYNLMSNAIKFTPAGGKVGLRARKDDAGIEITVWDTGIGIAAEELERVFEPFTRLGDAYTQETEGTGLGLTISRKIVELHGGKMWIESAGAGLGTSVRFKIPTGGVSK